MRQRPFRVILVHSVPNILGPLLVILTVDLASAILREATLSLLVVSINISCDILRYVFNPEVVPGC